MYRMGGIDNTTKYATHKGNCITALYKDNSWELDSKSCHEAGIQKQFLGMGEGTGLLLVLEPF